LNTAVEEGEGGVGAGDTFECVRTDPERVTVREACHLLYFDPENLEGSKKVLRIRALALWWRQSFEEQLTKLGS
jgi:MOSC domain-containing protein YiiM